MYPGTSRVGAVESLLQAVPSWLTTACVVVLLALALLLAVLYLLGFLQGRRVSFWPPTIDPMSRTASAGSSTSTDADAATDSGSHALSRLARAGLIDIFRDDEDPRFLSFFLERIRCAERIIFCTGLGLRFLYAKHRLTRAIRQRVIEADELSVYLLFGDPANPALLQRIKEEIPAVEGHYTMNWPLVHFEFVDAEVRRDLSEAQRGRVHVERLSFFPMTSVIRIDTVFLLYPYGAPSQSGWSSPWFAVDGARAETDEIVPFLTTFCEYALSHRKPMPLNNSSTAA